MKFKDMNNVVKQIFKYLDEVFIDVEMSDDEIIIKIEEERRLFPDAYKNPIITSVKFTEHNGSILITFTRKDKNHDNEVVGSIISDYSNNISVFCMKIVAYACAPFSET